MEKHFGSLDFFESGAEARDQHVGKVADEAHGIGEKDLAAGGKLQQSKLGGESREHPGRFEHVGRSEGIEEGALAGVRVADQGDNGYLWLSRRKRPLEMELNRLVSLEKLPIGAAEPGVVSR